MSETFNLERFSEAQDQVYEGVLRELRDGSKHGHWMWFIFPQLKGLGHSQMANYYGISSGQEARAYLDHPLLGTRLLECTEIVNGLPDKSISSILGYPDDLKFRSSKTLFSIVAPDSGVFHEALRKFFGGKADERTAQLLEEQRMK